MIEFKNNFENVFKIIENLNNKEISCYQISKKTKISEASLSKWKNCKRKPSQMYFQILYDFYKTIE